MIQYQTEPGLGVEEFIALLARTSLGERRPLNDVARMERILREADILLTARAEDHLVGMAAHDSCWMIRGAS